jgi:putative tryptophan/tyrosine transport system substrate-binding protein
LRELDWIEGRSIAIDYRWAEGRTERAAEIFADFVRLKVDVIVTHATALAVAAKQATSLIPIVFAVAGDPVGAGLVTSLARPGSNVTGLSLQLPDTVSKRLELLREIVPGLRRLAIITNPVYDSAVSEMREVQTLAGRLGLEVTIFQIARAEDIAAVFEALKGRSDALYICTDPLVNTHRAQINSLLLKERLPSVCGFPQFVEAGGLLSYGANYPALFRRAGEFVDKILRGTKPADIPVEQPTKFDLVINLKTAEALGLEVPPTLLARGDEVIE